MLSYVNQSSYRRSSALRLTALFALALIGWAMPKETRAAVATGNQFVVAEVAEGSGYVSIWTAPGSSGGKFLSYQDHSYLTVLINSKYYTNNPTSYAAAVQAGLTNVVSIQSGALVSKLQDTIRTIWNLDGVKVIQDVYPVKLTRSGQIIISIRFTNTTGVGVSCGTEYLLDTKPENDQSRILTRYNYSPNWKQYPNSSQSKIPNFYLTFQNSLPNPPSYDPGVVGMGYTENPAFGVKPPSRMTIGDWNALIMPIWGPPAIPSSPYNDSGILFEFNTVGVNPGATSDPIRISYGTGEYDMCNGNLFSLIFYSHYLAKNGAGNNYSPNPFTVEVFTFNTSSVTTASNVKLTLEVGPYLHVSQPTTPMPAKTATQATVPSAIAPLDVAYTEWKILADPATDCSGETNTYFRFTADGAGLPSPLLFPCELPLTMPCLGRDVEPPIIDNIDDKRGVNINPHYDFRFHEGRQLDAGLKQITWVAKPPVGKFAISVGNFLPCSNSENPHLLITDLDTCIPGEVDVIVSDCAHNTTYDTIIFAARNCTPPPTDVNPPRFFTTGYGHKWGDTVCSAFCDTISVVDNLPADLGIQDIKVIAPNNMSATIEPFSPGAKIVGVTVCVIDTMLDGSLTLSATDMKGHTTISDITMSTYCTRPDVRQPELNLIRIKNDTWEVYATDNKAWDRGLKDIIFPGLTIADMSAKFRSSIPFANLSGLNGKDSLFFTLTVIDTFQAAGFCIQAVDMAGNICAPYCPDWKPINDTWAPTIDANPPVATGPVRTTISIGDVHWYTTPHSDNTKIGWDKGIDSVWFSGNTASFILPAGVEGKYSCGMTIPSFEIAVRDTLAIDSQTCMSVSVRDCGGNITTLPICYPVSPDNKAPVIAGVANGLNRIDFTITDQALYDRGLQHVSLDNAINFAPLDLDLNRDAQTTTQITSLDPGKSAVGTFRAVDFWGTQVPAQTVQHSSSIDVAIWVQDMEMKKSFLITESGDFTIPVTIHKNDDFLVSQKQLTEFSFSFALTGDAGITYRGVDLTNTAINGWTVSAPTTPVGGVYTVKATAPAGQFLTDAGTSTVLKLLFNGQENELTVQSKLEVVQQNGVSITYNGGNAIPVTGTNAIATVPAPYGALGGAVIAVKGSCSPVVADGSKPTVVSLEPVRPNPFRNTAAVRYSVPETGPVRVELYNNLGVKIATVVNEIQEQGNYDLKLPLNRMASGQYYVRLETAGKVRTRPMQHE